MLISRSVTRQLLFRLLLLPRRMSTQSGGGSGLFTRQLLTTASKSCANVHDLNVTPRQLESLLEDPQHEALRSAKRSAY